MPRLKRSSAKAAANAASSKAPPPTSKSSKASTAFQPKSTNALKRPINDLSSESSEKVKGNPQDPDQPQAKRITISSHDGEETEESSIPQSTISKLPKATPKSKKQMKKKTQSWDVSGTYNLTCTSRYQPVNASSYALSLCYKRGPSSSQLFGIFEFGDLKGVMRLCPERTLTSKDSEADSDSGSGSESDEDQDYESGLLMLPDFEKACQLPDGVQPGPKFKEWLMRWRGKEGEKIVGGESRAQGQFNFKHDAESSTGEYEGVKITFAMLYQGRHLLFEGVKKGNLEQGSCCLGSDNDADLDSDFDLEKEWQSLFREEWEALAIPQPHNDWYGPPPTYSWDPPAGGVIKAKNKPGPNPGAYPKPKSSFIDAPPAWAWDVSGSWEITPSGNGNDKLRKFTMDLYMANNPFHCKTGRQLWGTFKIGQGIVGAVRLCPDFLGQEKGLRISKEKEEDSPLPVFEKACILHDGVWPGAPSDGGTPTWHFRWRGMDTNHGIADSTGDIQSTTMTFNQSGDGDGTVSLTGTFMWDEEEVPVTGLRTGPGKPRSVTAPIVTRVWDGYMPRSYLGRGCTRLSDIYDPQAEEEAEREELERSRTDPNYYLARPRYPPGGIPDYIEERPSWAWDVTGEWTVESPALRTELNIEDEAHMSISLRMANSPLAGQRKRQMYAGFRFAALEGCMRFAPVPASKVFASTQSARVVREDLADFERATHLNGGAWPGPLPRGVEGWKMRYRALDHRTGEMDPSADERETVVRFYVGEEGRLGMKGVMVLGEKQVPFEATRMVREMYTNGNEAALGSGWGRYKRKTRS
ncbi:hypothetical protein BKA65DRAFT_475628 [Rhexocercosporidium sp. MPI-PUGE-AT-0058]|nr:hypothetical protein BKA65DRAFT_475628 [Rhexocercosporidium sp. MPI-PUGE-AT-0058]